jgi:hypothetical protein
MKPDGPLPFPQQPITRPYAEKYESNQHHRVLFLKGLIHGLPSTSESPEWSFASGVPEDILTNFFLQSVGV